MERTWTRNEVVTAQEAANLLGKKVETIKAWTRSGYLERAVIASSWYLSMRSVREVQNSFVRIGKPGPYYERNREIVRKSGLGFAWKLGKSPFSGEEAGDLPEFSFGRG
ncbi:MAG: DNA-binding protein [Hyphomicrobiaceae bacterium]|nr:MAG: DNA-binding protein [Hyphomicrobiaceae bacterium]